MENPFNRVTYRLLDGTSVLKISTPNASCSNFNENMVVHLLYLERISKQVYLRALFRGKFFHHLQVFSVPFWSWISQVHEVPSHVVCFVSYYYILGLLYCIALKY